MKKADVKPAAGIVIIQDNTMFLNRDQSTALALLLSFRVRLCVHPTNTTLPTLQCVVDIGSPSLLANNTVAEAPFSITKPLQLQS